MSPGMGSPPLGEGIPEPLELEELDPWDCSEPLDPDCPDEDGLCGPELPPLVGGVGGPDEPDGIMGGVLQAARHRAVSPATSGMRNWRVIMTCLRSEGAISSLAWQAGG